MKVCRPWLSGAFAVVAIAWFPAVVLRFGIEQVGAQAVLALNTFLGLSILAVPIWGFFKSIVVVLEYIGDVPRLRRQQRIRQGLCVQCAYNLRGNVSGICPECGAAVAREVGRTG